MSGSSPNVLSDVLNRLEHLARENEALIERISLLERGHAEGAPATGDAGGPDFAGASDPQAAPKVSRRRLLGRAGAVAAGGLGLVLADGALRAPSAQAANGDKLTLGGNGNTATAPTGLAVTQPLSNGVYGLGVTDGGLQKLFPYSGAIAGHAKSTYEAGIFGYGEGFRSGVLGMSDSQSGVEGVGQTGVRGSSLDAGGYGVEGLIDSGIAGVHGYANHSGDGVYGQTYLDIGPGAAIHGTAILYGEAVLGEIISTDSGYDAIHGTTAGGGAGVHGEATDGPGVHGQAGAGDGVRGRSDSGRGVTAESSSNEALLASIVGAANASSAAHARTVGTGPAMWGEIANGTSKAAAVSGATVGKGAGVEGSSTKGRGGVFAGKLAQIRLTPSSAAGPPAAGAAGDLFVDSTNRLWFCTAGGTSATWRQVQLA